MKIKYKLTPYKPSPKEAKVIKAIGSDITPSCWKDLNEVKSKLDKQIDYTKTANNLILQKILYKRKSALIFNRIRDLKKNIKEHYKEDLDKQNSSYICYYCEEALTSRGRDKENDLDHILCKSVYRKLTLNTFNLIPTCTMCNRQLKKAESFCINENLKLKCTEKYNIIHPYLDNKIDFIEEFEDFVYVEKKTNPLIELKAHKTIQIFKLNHPEMIEERRKESHYKEYADNVNTFMHKNATNRK